MEIISGGIVKSNLLSMVALDGWRDVTMNGEDRARMAGDQIPAWDSSVEEELLRSSDVRFET